MKNILEILKSQLLNVIGFIFIIGFGINTYQTVKEQNVKFENELYSVLFTPLNVAIGESILLMLGLLVLTAFLTQGIKKLEIAGLFGFEIGEKKKKLIQTATKPLRGQKFLRALRTVKTQVMSIVQRESNILDLLTILVKELEVYYKNESGLNIPVSVFEVDGSEDDIVKTLLSASLESGNVEFYENSSVVRKEKFMVYAFNFEGKVYGVVSNSFKYSYDESDSELLLGIVGLAEDWFELSQAYIEITTNI